MDLPVHTRGPPCLLQRTHQGCTSGSSGERLGSSRAISLAHTSETPCDNTVDTPCPQWTHRARSRSPRPLILSHEAVGDTKRPHQGTNQRPHEVHPGDPTQPPKMTPGAPQRTAFGPAGGHPRWVPQAGPTEGSPRGVLMGCPPNRSLNLFVCLYV